MDLAEVGAFVEDAVAPGGYPCFFAVERLVGEEGRLEE